MPGACIPTKMGEKFYLYIIHTHICIYVYIYVCVYLYLYVYAYISYIIYLSMSDKGWLGNFAQKKDVGSGQSNISGNFSGVSRLLGLIVSVILNCLR